MTRPIIITDDELTPLPKHIPRLIDKASAARLLNMTPQNFNMLIKSRQPRFLEPNLETNKIQVNTQHEEFVLLYNEVLRKPKRLAGTVDQKNKGRSLSAKSAKKQIENAVGDTGTLSPDDNAALMQMALDAQIAERQTIIAKAKIAEEKAKQEELKTLDLMKNTVPIELMYYWFSFAENMIQRLYRRPHEIEPELEALFLGGNKKGATQKIIRELEAIVVDLQNKLIEQINADGYEVRETVGKGKK